MFRKRKRKTTYKPLSGKLSDILFFIMLSCTTFGLCGTVFWSFTFLKADAVHDWQKTDGVVTGYDFETGLKLHYRNETAKTSTVTRDSSAVYRPLVKYNYRVNGREYRGSRINMVMAWYNSKEEAAEKQKPYPISSYVEVFYEKGDPQNSVLEQGGSSGALILSLISMGILAAGIAAAFIRNKNRNTASPL